MALAVTLRWGGSPVAMATRDGCGLRMERQHSTPPPPHSTSKGPPRMNHLYPSLGSIRHGKELRGGGGGL